MGSGGLDKLDKALGKIGPLDPTRLLHNKRLKTEAENKQKRIDANAADEAAAENEAADAANLTLSTARRRRRLSSLFAGGRSVLGAPAGRGAPAGAGGGSGGGSGSGSGSAMGGSRSYGGSSYSGGGGRMYSGESLA